MYAHVERHSWPCATVRMGPDGWSYGEPYLAEFTLVFSEPEVEIVGVAQTPTPAMWRALAEALAREGLPGARFKRIGPDGRERWGWLKARAV